MAQPKKKESLPAKLVSELAKLADDASRARYLTRHPKLCSAGFAQKLNEIVRTKLRADTREALSLAEIAVAIARKSRDREILGRTLRSKANALYMIGDNQKALEFHAEAIEIFRKLGNAQEEARTLIPSIQPFILLGEYGRAFTAAEQAKKILEHLGDKQRLGHLEINVGNIYHRQDRFEEGLACYERAYETLLP
ncbi:MAG: tetratricopeptide repeat protein, partial [Candidatus Acidiferrales bacterium]